MLLHLEGKRHAGGHRHCSRHNGDGGGHAFFQVTDVHGAALAVAAARGFSEQLVKDGFRAQPPRQGVAMRAVRAGDDVARFQRAANAHGNAFLPLVLMNGAGHDAFQKEVLDALLKLPDQHHFAIKRKEKMFLVCHTYSPPGINWVKVASIVCKCSMGCKRLLEG